MDLSLDRDQTAITGWRERLLFRILYCAFALGSIAYAFNALIALQSQQWLRVAAYTTIYAGGILITFVRGIPYTPRAWAGLFLLYLLGVLSLATIGPAGSGRMWLLAFTILASLLLGLKSALAAMGLSSAAFVALSVLVYTRQPPDSFFVPHPFQHWIASGFTFVFINTVVAIALGVFIGRLEQAFSKEKALTALLKTSNARLKKAEGVQRRMAEELEERVAERTQALKSANLKLQQAQKMEAIGTLAGGIAHDFNNLLMAIQGNTSLLLFDTDASTPQFQALKNIEHTVASGKKLTQQILGYARKGNYLPRPIALNPIVRETAQTVAGTRKGTALHLDLAEDLMAVSADEAQMLQVLLNLFVNAAEAMPAGGRLQATTSNVTQADIRSRDFVADAGRYIKLTVTDSGVGMDAKTRARIFEPFFTTKKMGRGTGLGLASVYGIVKAHGGTIEVESEEQRGSSFHVYLPATDQPVAEPPKPDATIAMGKGTVLLVDDQEIVLQATAGMIAMLGYDVIPVNSGREAIRIYSEQKDRIDLVVLDLIMPEMNGREVFQRMKTIHPQVKVLLSSGYSLDTRIEDMLALGCMDFIQKPHSIESLSAKIMAMVGGEGWRQPAVNPKIEKGRGGSAAFVGRILNPGGRLGADLDDPPRGSISRI